MRISLNFVLIGGMILVFVLNALFVYQVYFLLGFFYSDAQVNRFLKSDCCKGFIK